MDKLSLQITNIDCDVDKTYTIIKNEKSSNVQVPINNINNDAEENPSKRKRKKSRILLEMENDEVDEYEMDDTFKEKFNKSASCDSDSDFDAQVSPKKPKKSSVSSVNKSGVKESIEIKDINFKLKGLPSKSNDGKPKPHNKSTDLFDGDEKVKTIKTEGKARKSVEIKNMNFTNDGIEVKSEKLSKPANNKISPEMKKKIINALESGACNRKTAASAFNLPYATVVTIYKKFLQTGVMGRKQKEQKITEEHVQWLSDTLAENCKYTIKELTEMVRTQFDLEVHYVSISKKIPEFHYNINRIKEVPCIEVTPEIINEHREYCDLFLALHNIGRPIIYYDEAEFKLLMRRFSRRLGSGQPGQVTAPSLRTRQRTMMLSMCNDGILLFKALEEETRRKRDLLNYVKELFVLLKSKELQKAIIIMGNATVDYLEELKELAQSEGHQLLFLPAQCKWFNPVETLFSQLPTIIRTKNPANESILEYMIDNLTPYVTAQQCQSYLMNVVKNVNDCVKGELKYDD